MSYLIYRIKESRGFVAKRVIHQACYIALMLYGNVCELNGRVITPEISHFKGEE